MDINSIMSGQLAQLQQTLSMTLLDKSLTQGAAGVVEMLEEMPAQPAQHPHKGQFIDMSI